MMVQILFGKAASGSCKLALEKINLHKDEKIISFADIFSIGPIWKLDSEIGMNFRFEWMRKCMSDIFNEHSDYMQQFKKAFHQVNVLPEGTHVTIWASDNAHEQTGLRYILYLLKEKNMRINVRDATKEYKQLFQAKNVELELLHTGEIAPEEFQQILKHSHGKVLSDYDRECLEKEWLFIAETRKTLRIWHHSKIESVMEDYYDKFIIKNVKILHGKKTEEFLKSARVIAEVLVRLAQYVGDNFLDNRIRKLIEAGIFESKDNLTRVRFYSLRLKQEQECRKR